MSVLLVPAITLEWNNVQRQDDLRQRTNILRVAWHLSPLSLHKLLQDEAQRKAEDMVAFHRYGHENSDGIRGAEQTLTAGIAWSLFGENICAGAGESQQALDAWVPSPDHYKNLSKAGYTHQGVGTATEPVGATYLNARDGSTFNAAKGFRFWVHFFVALR